MSSNKSSETDPRLSLRAVLTVNMLFLPFELGFTALVMFCGDDGKINWDIMAALGMMFFTLNAFAAASVIPDTGEEE